jgi:hypothetical protein
MGMERALLQESREFAGLEAAEVVVPEWVRYVEDANEAIRLLHVKRTIHRFRRRNPWTMASLTYEWYYSSRVPSDGPHAKTHDPIR